VVDAAENLSSGESPVYFPTDILERLGRFRRSDLVVVCTGLHC
jgi:hypothetical protein